MMVLAHGASFSEVHIRRFPSTVFLYCNLDPKFPAIPSSRGLFFHIPPPLMISIPNLAPIFLKIPHPEFQIWEIPDPEKLLGVLYQALRGLEFV